MRVLLRALFRMIAVPRRAAATLALAARTARPDISGALWQAFYAIEAAVLTGHLKRDGVRRLHKHFAGANRTVAMLTSRLSGVPFSFTLHGPSDLYEPKSWHLGEKIVRVEFVSRIRHFARSQSVVFAGIGPEPAIQRF